MIYYSLVRAKPNTTTAIAKEDTTTHDALVCSIVVTSAASVGRVVSIVSHTHMNFASRIWRTLLIYRSLIRAPQLTKRPTKTDTYAVESGVKALRSSSLSLSAAAAAAADDDAADGMDMGYELLLLLLCRATVCCCEHG